MGLESDRFRLPIAKNIEEALFLPGLGFPPDFVLRRFNAMLAKYGEKHVLSDRVFQKSREMWPVAVMLLALQSQGELPRLKVWLEPNYDDPPDIFIRHHKQHPVVSQGQMEEVYHIEVVEWSQRSEDLIGLIEKKNRGVRNPPYFRLLVHAKKPGEVDLDYVFQHFSEHGLEFSEIWLLSAVEHIVGDHLLVRIFPRRLRIDFYLEEIIKYAGGREDIMVRRRGVRSNPIDFGRLNLKLPDIE